MRRLFYIFSRYPASSKVMNAMSDAERYFRDGLLPPLQNRIAKLEHLIGEAKPDIERLLNIPAKYVQIVDFGSGTGWSTLALTIGLRSYETVGIDNKKDLIDRANRDVNSEFLEDMFRDLGKLRAAFERVEVRKDLAPETRSTVEGIVTRFEFQPSLQFRFGDLTQPEPINGLPSNHFDLAHSRYCLYQIYCANPVSRSDLDRALVEMTRVVKSGGLLAAHEPCSCANDEMPHFDLGSSLVNQRDLAVVHYSEENDYCVAIARKK